MKFVRWCIHNPVPINLIIIIFIILGVYSSMNLQRETFPEFDMEVVDVTITTDGSFSPELVDKSIVEVVYPAIEGVDGISKINSHSSRNSARFFIEVAKGYNSVQVKDDIEDEISSIRGLPDDANTPIVNLLSMSVEALRIAIWSNEATPWELFKEATKLKQELKSQNIAQQVKWNQKNQFEIEINASPEMLHAKGLTFAELSNQISNYSFEAGAGKLISDNSSIFLQGKGRKDHPEEFLNIPIELSSGETISLYELTGLNGVSFGFKEDNPLFQFNGSSAMVLIVEKSADDDLIVLSDKVKDFLSTYHHSSHIEFTTFSDSSSIVKQRLGLIIENGYIGIILILIILTLFLNGRTAFWVTMGIVLSILGSLLVLYLFDQSLNMISLFGLLITCGIIVDDAIVMGESYSLYRLQGLSPEKSALSAFKEMAVPILAMMSTTIVAFLPLFFVDGVMGKFISVMPLAIVAALGISMLESLFILPAHLAYPSRASIFQWPIIMRYFVLPLRRVQKSVQVYLRIILKKVLIPITWFCLYHRYAVAICFGALLIFLSGLTLLGIIPTSLFPNADSDYYFVTANLEEGVPISKTEEVANIINKALKETIEEEALKGNTDIVKHYYMEVGTPKENKCSLQVELVSYDDGREMSGSKFIEAWRKKIPAIPRLRSMEFKSKQGGPNAKPIAIQLSSQNEEDLSIVEKKIKTYLKSLAGVVDIGSTSVPGLPVAEISIREGYSNFKIGERELIQSIYNAFQGSQIDQFYTQQSEVNVVLRIPRKGRESIYELKEYILPNGMPLKQIADIKTTFTPSMIQRVNGQKAIEVYADIDESYKNHLTNIRQDVFSSFIPTLLKQYPSIHWSQSGESEDAQKSVKSLFRSYLPALLVIYLILATIFKSYLQPIIIMSVIPFGFIGAILGHLLLGISFNLMSGFGLIALTGIVVNDSLILIDLVNKILTRGISLEKALLLAVKRRFRPILLTSITTIAGLAPILFETSFQAQFLIPMVTTIVFGLGFSTLLIFLLVPAGYAIYKDIYNFTHKLF